MDPEGATNAREQLNGKACGEHGQTLIVEVSLVCSSSTGISLQLQDSARKIKHAHEDAQVSSVQVFISS